MKRRPNIDNDQLLPCPFCASRNVSVSQGLQGDKPFWYIECEMCAATADSDAIWNSRKFPESTSHEELES